MAYRLTFRSAALVLALLALTACNPDAETTMATSVAGASAAQAAEPSSRKRLAVAHAFMLRLPSKEIEGTQQRHLQECAKLGCTVLNTRLNRMDDGRINAFSSVRIAPDAYASFAATITSPPAQTMSHSETAEDKTLPLLDVEKRLEVKKALRDRLNAMLREPGSKTAADLASIEKELAQVQADIETAVAEQDYLRKVTETVKVDVSYNGTAAQAGGLDLSPIDRAIDRSGSTLVASIATLISFVVALVPWLPVIVLLVWCVRRGVRRWRARKAAG